VEQAAVIVDRLIERPEEAVDRDALLTNGCALFPGDNTIRAIAERQNNVVHWTEHDRGGHFAAMEAPDLLVEDIRTFFRKVR
jgi:hypothetical protein